MLAPSSSRRDCVTLLLLADRERVDAPVVALLLAPLPLPLPLPLLLLLLLPRLSLAACLRFILFVSGPFRFDFVSLGWMPGATS